MNCISFNFLKNYASNNGVDCEVLCLSVYVINSVKSYKCYSVCLFFVTNYFGKIGNLRSFI